VEDRPGVPPLGSRLPERYCPGPVVVDMVVDTLGAAVLCGQIGPRALGAVFLGFRLHFLVEGCVFSKSLQACPSLACTASCACVSRTKEGRSSKLSIAAYVYCRWCRSEADRTAPTSHTTGEFHWSRAPKGTIWVAQGMDAGGG
jgi:hypothetical protein